MRHLKNEKGLSLVELLATLLITILLAMIAYAILFNGFKAYERATIEAELRDEADLIMAGFISEFFPMKESDIVAKHLPDGGSSDFFVEDKFGGKYGFMNGKIYFGTEAETVLQNEKIILGDNSAIKEVSPGQYRISLELLWIDNEQSLMLENEIGTIADKD